MSHNIIIADNPELFYTVRTRKKKSGKTRTIHAPSPALKEIQREFTDWFYNKNKTMFNVNRQITGFLPGKSIADNAKPHLNKDWIINLDIKDFFPSTNDERVKNLVQNLPRSASPLDWLKRKKNKPTAFKRMSDEELSTLLVLNGGLPQGSPASPVIANYIGIEEIDKLVHTGIMEQWNALHVKDLNYTRYADDLTLSFNLGDRRMAEHIAQLAVAKVRQGLYDIKDQKTVIKHKSQRQAVTGVIVNGKQPRIDRRLMNNMRAAVYNANKNDEELSAETKGMLSFIQSINKEQYEKLTKQGDSNASN